MSGRSRKQGRLGVGTGQLPDRNILLGRIERRFPAWQEIAAESIWLLALYGRRIGKNQSYQTGLCLARQNGKHQDAKGKL